MLGSRSHPEIRRVLLAVYCRIVIDRVQPVISRTDSLVVLVKRGVVAVERDLVLSFPLGVEVGDAAVLGEKRFVRRVVIDDRLIQVVSQLFR